MLETETTHRAKTHILPSSFQVGAKHNTNNVKGTETGALSHPHAHYYQLNKRRDD